MLNDCMWRIATNIAFGIIFAKIYLSALGYSFRQNSRLCNLKQHSPSIYLSILLAFCTVADPDQAFGGQSNKGPPKSLHPSFPVAIVGYHAKVVTFYRPRK